jgi:hypothetical protein
MAEDAKTQGRAIFISYRRDDTEGEAGRLFDDLVRAYGDDSVFMDVTGIQPGLDFRKAIDANVSSCGVLLAVIGPTWATITDSSGNRRLDNPNDYVRLEISNALARNIAVIPVLVHGARMPPLDQLPDDLKDLRYRNSVELTHARWNSDVALLTGALKSYVTVNTAHQNETVHATVPVQLPAPQDPTPAKLPQKSKRPLWIGVGAAAVLILAIAIAVVVFKPAPNPLAPFLGDWQDVETPALGDDLIRFQVATATQDAGAQILVHAWGRCPQDFCDWGEHHARLNGDELVTEAWQLSNTAEGKSLGRSAVIRMRPSANGLTVTVRNTFHPVGAQEAKQNESHLEFIKGFR